MRVYDPTKRPSKIQLKDLLRAAMYAPSAMDARPWEFLVLTELASIESAVSILPHCSSLGEAGVAIVVCGNLDREFKTQCGGYYRYDCSAATQNILLRAKELGLGTCWCGIAPERDRIDAFRKKFNIPENIEPMALVVVGYAAENPDADERYDEKKVHWESWMRRA